MEQWRMRGPDKSPLHHCFHTFEQIHDMLRDNPAEYDRNKTLGIPARQSALHGGLCGVCGHTMVVQYKGVHEYLCNLRRVSGPVCQECRRTGDAVSPVFRARRLSNAI